MVLYKVGLASRLQLWMALRRYTKTNVYVWDMELGCTPLHNEVVQVTISRVNVTIPFRYHSMLHAHEDTKYTILWLYSLNFYKEYVSIFAFNRATHLQVGPIEMRSFHRL